MSMRKIVTVGIVALMGVMTVIAAVEVPKVSNVKARQRYPWNGLVDIDYTISGDASGLSVLITMKDGATGKSYTPTKFHEVLPTSEGSHRVTWSTEAEGLTSLVTSRMIATVSLMRVADAPVATDGTYLVIDLSGGPTSITYPVSYLNSVPNGGVWPDEYKTSKLVLRKIPAGKVKGISITKPFYCGVFEVTQRQYELVMGENPTQYRGDKRAVENVPYDTIRGSSAGAGWPGSAAVDETSFMGKIRARTALLTLDLPTESQWEYACRAGTTSDYNNGGSTEADLRTLGRFYGNQDDGRGGYSSGPTTVGSYAPNNWGLYDMHGNVYEWCLDWLDSSGRWSQTPISGTDLKGPTSGEGRVIRGGCWSVQNAGVCSSSQRDCATPSYQKGVYCLYGFRLVCSAGL